MFFSDFLFLLSLPHVFLFPLPTLFSSSSINFSLTYSLFSSYFIVFFFSHPPSILILFCFFHFSVTHSLVITPLSCFSLPFLPSFSFAFSLFRYNSLSLYISPYLFLFFSFSSSLPTHSLPRGPAASSRVSSRQVCRTWGTTWGRCRAGCLCRTRTTRSCTASWTCTPSRSPRIPSSCGRTYWTWRPVYWPSE